VLGVAPFLRGHPALIRWVHYQGRVKGTVGVATVLTLAIGVTYCLKSDGKRRTLARRGITLPLAQSPDFRPTPLKVGLSRCLHIRTTATQGLVVLPHVGAASSLVDDVVGDRGSAGASVAMLAAPSRALASRMLR
jgi:hypothetical protein